MPTVLTNTLRRRTRDAQVKVFHASNKPTLPLPPRMAGWTLPPKVRSKGTIVSSSSGRMDAATRIMVTVAGSSIKTVRHMARRQAPTAITISERGSYSGSENGLPFPICHTCVLHPKWAGSKKVSCAATDRRATAGAILTQLLYPELVSK
ncbi:hypothetical protein HCDG_02429 [Histoplasma capsulatum H143]|uniref:Uncharacterized protein n=1 Tax=Ajellomyces capsulatus (strain H143) TaxID=544712 RepID=C6H7M8_AJECH|nr:hypothetical protein HCDG_02429 [Histoplasma capsulatum H143]